MIVWARYVDEKGRRIINLAIACFLGGVGLLLPIISGSLLLAVIGFSLALVGVTAARAIFWTIPTRFLTGVAAAGGLAFINSIATVGGFVGPSMMGWLKEFSGSYVVGLLAVAAIMVVAAIAAMSLKLVISRE
jgi:nitrate/nitrite transporter NarK